MKKLTIAVAAFLSPVIYAQTYVDLSQSFNADVFLESGGTGFGEALDEQGRRIDAGTLPNTYTDGSTVTSTNGQATFRFAPLKTESLDAVQVDGQTIDVTDGRYSSVDLALLSASGAFLNPFSTVDFVYADGSTNSARLGPVAGWFSSPTVFDNALFRYTDQSGVAEHVSFPTDGTSDVDYLYQTQGSALSGGWRFADGNGYFLYRLPVTNSIGKLGITVGNNFVISVATNYVDPAVSTTEGYTKLASSQEIYGVDHHSLGNLKEYEFDVTPYLASGTGELWVLLTDGSTSDGWGPYVQRIRVFEGEALNFEERLQPTIDASGATVYADFQIASTNETPFLYDNSGSGPSNRGHRFADASGSLTYRFNLPDDVTDAKMTVDMENNFVVSLAGPAAAGTSYGKFTANTESEATYLIEAPGTATQETARFADAGAHMIYEFDLPDTAATAFARVRVGNQFVISAAAGAAGEYVTLKDYVAETGIEVRDRSNEDIYTVDLTTFLVNNPSKVVRIRLTDGVPTDGWGPYLRGIEVLDSESAGALNFTEVLNSQTMFGEDFHNEANRNYYTIDLSSVLTNNNPGREVNIRFTDGSTFDGWGPSLYWMSVYSGEIEIHTDSLVFPNLKTTAGDPASRPVGLMSRNYPLDPSKTLTAIQLPEHPGDQSSRVYLLAATLNPATTTGEPELQVARVDADTIRISWPAAEGYRLQFSATLGAIAQWSNVTEPVQNNGGTMSAEVDTAGQHGFYRLVK